MLAFTAIASVLSAIVPSITGAVTKRQDLKLAKETAKAKIRQSAQDNQQFLSLSELEIRAIDRQNQSGTWKDEVAFLTGVSPYWLIILGAILAAFGHPEFAAGTAEGLGQLKDMGVPVGELIGISICVGLGTKVIRR